MKAKDRFALKDSPVFGVCVILLFALGIVLLPGEKLGKLLLGHGGVDARNLGNALFRLAGFVVLLLLALDLGVRLFSRWEKTAWLTLPFLAVVINNAPIVGSINGSVTVHAGAGSWAIFALCCLAVGLFEELTFRGLILPLLLRKTGDTKKGTLWAVLLSSALFGAVHLVNLLSSAPLAVLMQVGYSFLIGAMCAVILLLGHNISVCAFMHAGFNFCGLLADELGSGQVWNAASIALTAAVGVLAAAYGAWVFWRYVRPESVRALWSSEKKE